MKKNMILKKVYEIGGIAALSCSMMTPAKAMMPLDIMLSDFITEKALARGQFFENPLAGLRHPAPVAVPVRRQEIEMGIVFERLRQVEAVAAESQRQSAELQRQLITLQAQSAAPPAYDTVDAAAVTPRPLSRSSQDDE